jgi:hypothetical protein
MIKWGKGMQDLEKKLINISKKLNISYQLVRNIKGKRTYINL